MPEYTSDANGLFVVGDKEYYSDVIKDISPTSTPLFGMTGDETITSTTWEYYTADLEEPDADIALATKQGQTIAAEDEDRIQCQNRTQIFTKAVAVTYTQEVVNKVGINSELDWRGGRKLIANKKNYEARMLNGVYYRSPKQKTVASVMQGLAGICALWSGECQSSATYGDNSPNVNTNIQDFNSSAPDAMDEMNDLMGHMWDLGAEPNTVICSSLNKRYISAWDSSGVTRNTDQTNRIIENVEWFEGPHGTVKVVPHRSLGVYSDDADDSFDNVDGTGVAIKDFAFVLDPAMQVKGTLRGYGWQSENKQPDGLEYKRDYRFQGSMKSMNAASIGMFSFAGWAGHTNTKALSGTKADYDLT